MPVEIKEINIKATIQSKEKDKDDPCCESDEQKKLDHLEDQLSKKIKSRNER